MTILLTPGWQNTAGGPCAIPDKKLVAGGPKSGGISSVRDGPRRPLGVAQGQAP